MSKSNLLTDIFAGKGELTPSQKHDSLSGMAYTHEEGKYQRPLTQEELDKEKDELSKAMIELGRYEKELSDFKKEIKAKMKPFDMIKVDALQKIKTRQVEQEGLIYLIDDQETGMMGLYDKDGILINSRRLYPEEKQRNAFSGFGNVQIVERPEETRREGSND